MMAFEKNALAKELMKSAISGFGQLPAEQRADVAWKKPMWHRFLLEPMITGISCFSFKRKNCWAKK